jgi:hypothetical protein
MSEHNQRSYCPGCTILNHLQGIAECFEVMALSNPKIVTPDKQHRAAELCDEIASLIADYKAECT